MDIYKQILRYVRPFIKYVALSMFLTFLYVMLNNVSLWVSVDFIGELFLDEPVKKEQSVQPVAAQPVLAPADSLAQAAADTSGGVQAPAKPSAKDVVGSLNYRHAKKSLKRMLRRETKQETLKVICILIFVSFLFKNLFDYLRLVINKTIQLKIIVDLRNQLQAAAMRLPLGFFTQAHTGKLTSIVFNDVKALRQVLNNSLGKMILTPIQLLANVAILFWISWKLSLITLVLVPVSSLIITKIGQSIRRKSRRALKQISEVMLLFQEAVGSIQVVKAFTSEDSEIRKFRKANARFLKIQLRANRLGEATSPLNEIVAVFILVALLWYGGNLVQTGAFDAEDFVKFLLFLFTCLQPLQEMSKLNNIIQRGVAAAERIFGILKTPQEVYVKPGDQTLQSFDREIRLEKVSFKYHEDGPWVLRDIDLEIRKGQTVAFVGHSGSGKTTLVNLIPRFYDVNEGRITLDGLETTTYTLTSLRDHIGMVTQETFLFNDTVRNNVAYGQDGEVSDAAVEAAAQAANALNFIQAMDQGFGALVGERGHNLSGGQRQRLSIARAILKNPPILILDEATSALDTESEKLVQDAIDSIMENRTVLVIAHRLSTVIHADKIVVLKKGRIVGMGPHAELLETCPTYRRLYEIQFSDQNRPEDV